MKYFNRNMTANEVRARLYKLLYVDNVSDQEKEEIKREHEQMCAITVRREMQIAEAGWMAE